MEITTRNAVIFNVEVSTRVDDKNIQLWLETENNSSLRNLNNMSQKEAIREWEGRKYDAIH